MLTVRWTYMRYGARCFAIFQIISALSSDLLLRHVTFLAGKKVPRWGLDVRLDAWPFNMTCSLCSGTGFTNRVLGEAYQNLDIKHTSHL